MKILILIIFTFIFVIIIGCVIMMTSLLIHGVIIFTHDLKYKLPYYYCSFYLCFFIFSGNFLSIIQYYLLFIIYYC